MGAFLFQLQGGQVFEEAFPSAAFFEIREGELRGWSAAAEQAPLIGWSAATFDEAEGCWVIGGFEARTNRELVPVILRRCGDIVSRLPLPVSIGANPRAVPRRVVALARDPQDGSMLAALELHEADQARPNISARRVSPNDLGADRSGGGRHRANRCRDHPALVTDWPRGRVLVRNSGSRPSAGSQGERRASFGRIGRSSAISHHCSSI